jgi:pimeloyl-ACP methyl ester carboxylesterase
MNLFHTGNLNFIRYIESMKILIHTIIVIISFCSFLYATPKPHVLKLSSGASITALSSITDPSRPTIILLPGIYRGYLQNEKVLHFLTQKKINWVSLHFSRHPQSILAGSLLLSGMISSEQLAHEVLLLKKNLRIQKPVLVSLSFSASLSPYLKKKDFPVLIETAPMGRFDETQVPDQNYQNWQQWMNQFPVWGPWLVQSNEYWSYRAYWLKEVDGLVGTYPQYLSKRITIAEGLAQLAWSTRNFDLRNQNFKTGPERFWILGEKENAQRLKIQQEAIQLQRQQTGSQGRRVYVIKNAGHIVPFEQPQSYVNALAAILRQIQY